MAIEQDAAVLTELHETLQDAKDEKNTSESSVYFKEQLKSFSTASMPFGAVTAALVEQTEDLFALTRTCDRFSPEYRKLCKVLVKTVSHLGRSYLTKTGLAQKKLDITGLENLSAERLYEMISCNFRKTEAALNEKKILKQEFDLNLYNQLLTFASVMERLRSTQHTAWEINMCFRDAYDYFKGSSSFTDHDSNRRFADRDPKPGAFRESPSFAMRVDVLQEARDQQISAFVTEPEPGVLPAASSVESTVGEETVIEGTYAEASEPAVQTGSVSADSESAIEENTVVESASVEEREAAKDTSERPKLITELPSWKEVMAQVAARGGIQEDGSISLTMDEMCSMLCDSDFRRDEPELAEQFYKILEESGAGDLFDDDST